MAFGTRKLYTVSSTRVFLVDDHAVLRHGLRLLLEAQSDIEVVGESGSGRGVPEAIARAGGADVVLLDISLPDSAGHNVASEIRASVPSAKIVALTRHAEKGYVQQMLQHGADAYVLKQTAPDVLLEAIRTVARGGTYLDPAVAGKIAPAPRNNHARRTDELTPREREVLVMVAKGHTNKEIASLLEIAVKTVETHKANVMEKLEIRSRAELVRFAFEQGWLSTQ